MPIGAVLHIVVLVDQREPQESARHIDEDGLLEALAEIDDGRSVPIR